MNPEKIRFKFYVKFLDKFRGDFEKLGKSALGKNQIFRLFEDTGIKVMYDLNEGEKDEKPNVSSSKKSE